MLEVRTFVVGPFQENTYLLSDPESGEAVVIDPGGAESEIIARTADAGLRVVGILLTHGHLDHIAGAERIRRELVAPVAIHSADLFLLERAPEFCRTFGVPPIEPPTIDDSLVEGQEWPLGQHRIRVIETPGHSPGSVSLLVGDLLFSGDLLFQGSIGRTDFPGGSLPVLLRSIREKVLPLPDRTRVLSGHGPETTVGRERAENPFLSDDFQALA